VLVAKRSQGDIWDYRRMRNVYSVREEMLQSSEPAPLSRRRVRGR
jgi:hypothetical protein